MLSAEDHEYVPDSSSQDNDGDPVFGEKLSKEEIEREMTEQVNTLRRRTGIAPSKVVEKAIARAKERDYKVNSRNSSQNRSPIKNRLDKNSNVTQGGELQNAQDLLQLARKGGSGIEMANKNKIKVKRK